MRILTAVFVLGALAGCAGDRYTRHESGWWTESAPRGGASVSIGYGWGSAWHCRPWYGPWGYAPHAWGACGYGFGYSGYGYVHPGAWWWPYPQGWYLPPRTIEGPRAGARARHLAGEPAEFAFPRYEDLAPQRRRELGGGGADHARQPWPNLRSGPDPRRDPRQGGLSGARDSSWGGGLSGSSRGSSNFGGSSRASAPSAGSSRSAGSSARSISESREEQ